MKTGGKYFQTATNKPVNGNIDFWLAFDEPAVSTRPATRGRDAF
jgi:hypothetical protein